MQIFCYVKGIGYVWNDILADGLHHTVYKNLNEAVSKAKGIFVAVQKKKNPNIVWHSDSLGSEKAGTSVVRPSAGDM